MTFIRPLCGGRKKVHVGTIVLYWRSKPDNNVLTYCQTKQLKGVGVGI